MIFVLLWAGTGEVCAVLQSLQSGSPGVGQALSLSRSSIGGKFTPSSLMVVDSFSAALGLRALVSCCLLITGFWRPPKTRPPTWPLTSPKPARERLWKITWQSYTSQSRKWPPFTLGIFCWLRASCRPHPHSREGDFTKAWTPGLQGPS